MLECASSIVKIDKKGIPSWALVVLRKVVWVNQIYSMTICVEEQQPWNSLSFSLGLDRG